VATTRVQKTVPATLAHSFMVGETATAPTGTPTYTVVAADGVSVQSGNTTVSGTTVSIALNGVATLELLTVTWTGVVSGATRVETDYVEVVGGELFTLAEGRVSDDFPTLKYTAADLVLARYEVEVECERICDRAFFPQYARVVLDGTGSNVLLLRHPLQDRTPGDVRTIRSVTMATRADGTFTAFTASELAAVQCTEDGRLVRVDGGAWTEGLKNVVVEYEYGWDAPPADLKRAALLRLRSRLNWNKSGVPERVLSYTVDGNSYRNDIAGTYKVGIPDVDGPYSGYSRRPGAGPGNQGDSGADGRPASRTLTYQVQRHSLFHR